jgi:hypothetical protein
MICARATANQIPLHSQPEDSDLAPKAHPETRSTVIVERESFVRARYQ